MRLYKKAAVCLLVAAMALSMMTACGPTGGGSNGGNSGNNDTSQGSGDTDDKGDNGDNKDDQGDKKDDQDDKGDKKDDQGDSVTPADPSKVTWETSMTKKYFQGISKDNFRVSGFYSTTGDLFAYATQGTKQLLADQEDEGYMFFYTPDGKELYVTILEKLPTGGIKVSQLTGWKTVEEFAKDMGATDADIAKEKATIFAQMQEMKESIYIADKTPTAFQAEDTVMMNANFYVETMAGVAVEGKAYTYTAVFAKEDFQGYKAGALVGVVKQNGGTSTSINLNSQISACTDDTFPNIK